MVYQIVWIWMNINKLCLETLEYPPSPVPLLDMSHFPVSLVDGFHPYNMLTTPTDFDALSIKFRSYYFNIVEHFPDILSCESNAHL